MDAPDPNQPEAGETILCCEHVEEDSDRPFQYFVRSTENGTPEIATVVKRENMKEYQIRWIILCADCAIERTANGVTDPFAGKLVRAVWGPEDMNTRVQ